MTRRVRCAMVVLGVLSALGLAGCGRKGSAPPVKSGSSMADIYDPNSMPPKLVKAHRELDRAVDAA